MEEILAALEAEGTDWANKILEVGDNYDIQNHL